jgi:hypothetical protein
LPRSYEYGLDYYFQRALPEWTPENTQARLLVSSKQGLQEFARFAQLENITRNHLFTPVTPDGRIFVVDLALAKPSGK